MVTRQPRQLSSAAARLCASQSLFRAAFTSACPQVVHSGSARLLELLTRTSPAGLGWVWTEEWELLMGRSCSAEGSKKGDPQAPGTTCAKITEAESILVY